MTITIDNYSAEGPFPSADNLLSQSGVYVILGRNGGNNYDVVDVGQSEDVRSRVSNHDRAPCWKQRGYPELTVAAIYLPHHQLDAVETSIRQRYNPPCGVY